MASIIGGLKKGKNNVEFFVIKEYSGDQVVVARMSMTHFFELLAVRIGDGIGDLCLQKYFGAVLLQTQCY